MARHRYGIDLETLRPQHLEYPVDLAVFAPGPYEETRTLRQGQDVVDDAMALNPPLQVLVVEPELFRLLLRHIAATVFRVDTDLGVRPGADELAARVEQ